MLIEPTSAVSLGMPSAETNIPMSENNPDVQVKSDDLSEETPLIDQESLIPAEDSHIPLPVNQASLIQTNEKAATPVQEISCAANSDAATEALPSHTLSISVVDDDDAEEATSVQIPAQVSEPPHPTTQPPSSESSRPLAKVKVCTVQYYQGMCADMCLLLWRPELLVLRLLKLLCSALYLNSALLLHS